jgi:hypothetical protein
MSFYVDAGLGWPTSGRIRIGESFDTTNFEDIDYSNYNNTTGLITVQTRGVNGTTAKNWGNNKWYPLDAGYFPIGPNPPINVFLMTFTITSSTGIPASGTGYLPFVGSANTSNPYSSATPAAALYAPFTFTRIGTTITITSLVSTSITGSLPLTSGAQFIVSSSAGTTVSSDAITTIRAIGLSRITTQLLPVVTSQAASIVCTGINSGGICLGLSNVDEIVQVEAPISLNGGVPISVGEVYTHIHPLIADSGDFFIAYAECKASTQEVVWEGDATVLISGTTGNGTAYSVASYPSTTTRIIVRYAPDSTPVTASIKQFAIWRCIAGKTASSSIVVANLVNDSGMTMQARWNWTSTSISGKWSRPQQCYRHPRLFLYNGVDDADDGEPIIVARNKITGIGHSLHLKFTAESNKDARFIGWSTSMQTLSDS